MAHEPTAPRPPSPDPAGPRAGARHAGEAAGSPAAGDAGLSRAAGLAEVARVFLRLGCTSFGGPVAHLGYFHAECVVRRRWLDAAHFADLVALAQFLPGPASSQVVFALGRWRAGLAGAAVASACFTLPSAALMIAAGYGVVAWGGTMGHGWLHGLKIAAVAVVAQAVWTMARKLCPDVPRAAVALAAGAVVTLVPGAGAFAQVGVIAAGGVVGWWWFRRSGRGDTKEALTSRLAGRESPANATMASATITAAPSPAVGSRRGGSLALGVWVALLIALPLVAAASGALGWRVADGFFRAGSLVFGGGHVVLPLLRAEVVPSGWMSDEAFVAGYGAAQALPGPLFAFAGYLGTVIAQAQGAGPAWLGGVGALLALFLPAWLLMGGALPWWDALRRRAWMQAALHGINAAVVGLLLAALYDPVGREGIRSLADLAAAVAAFAALQWLRLPAWLLVLVLAGAGAWWGR